MRVYLNGIENQHAGFAMTRRYEVRRGGIVYLSATSLIFSSLFMHGANGCSGYCSPHTASLFSFKNAATDLCLNMEGEPRLIANELNVEFYRGIVDGCGVLGADNPRQRFYLRDVHSKKFVDNIKDHHVYEIRSEDDPFRLCLERSELGGIRFGSCDGQPDQQFQFKKDEHGWEVHTTSDSTRSCVGVPFGGPSVVETRCDRKDTASQWKVTSEVTLPFVPAPGVGGDVALIERLLGQGWTLEELVQASTEEIAAAIDRDDVVAYRVQMLDNVGGTPVEGFLGCVLGDDAKTRIEGGKRGFACAYSDSDGILTYVGLPRNQNVVNRLSKFGYVQSAVFHYSDFGPSYHHEYVGTGLSDLAALGLNIDDRFPYSSSRGLNPGFGDISATVVYELDEEGSSGYGLIDLGDYEDNGVGGVQFRLYRAGEDGAFEEPYDDRVPNDPMGEDGPDGQTDGLKYLERANGVVFGDSEVPVNDRTATADEIGGALIFSVPEGEYELEIVVPDGLACFPGRDAWVATQPERARLVISEGFLSDVRFYCESP